MLTLSTRPPRPQHVVVDGAAYPLRPFDALPIAAFHRLARAWRVLRRLVPAPALTPADAGALVAALDAIVGEALPTLPAEIAARLTPTQGHAIAATFLQRGSRAA